MSIRRQNLETVLSQVNAMDILILRSTNVCLLRLPSRRVFGFLLQNTFCYEQCFP